MKVDKKDKLHILIIIVGMIFLAIPIFHSNLWFDEAYSVAIANHSFKEIWQIGGHDVHPVLYYWILHIINLTFGNNIMLYRIFSYICACIIGILGFTHIRKDFGKKVGLFFSFFSFFLPTITMYAGEIRMYSFAMLLVTIMSIYAYRLFKTEECNIKNWCIFAICSLGAAYTHYYGLMAAGIINLLLFTHYAKEWWKTKKINSNIKGFAISAIMQIILYLPWVLSLLLQINQVSQGFWIEIKPTILKEFLIFQFTGYLENNNLAFAFSISIMALLIYLMFRNIKNKKQNNNDKEYKNLIKLSLGIYFSIILAALIVSLIMSRPIIYARYMLCVTGLFMFFLAIYLSKNANKYILVIICILCITMGVIIEIKLCKDNYDFTNQEPFAYLRENIKEDDALFCANQGSGFSGFIISANYPDNFLYFWDNLGWNVEEAYKAFGKQMKTIHSLDEIENTHGKIWIISDGTDELLNELQKRYNVKVLEKRNYNVKYHSYQYGFTLIEK